MHNNEFEKRVEHKLKELKFTPSDAVWQKVQVQIHEQKRRRRFFFWWLPAIVLCTGVGAWFMYSTERGNTKTVATAQKTASSSSVKNNQNKTPETVPESKPVAEENNKRSVISKTIQKEQEAAFGIKTEKKAQVVDHLIIKDNRIVTGNKKIK